MFKPASIGFVLNPKAGRRKIDFWERELRSGLASANVKCEFVRTRQPREAEEISANLAREHELVVAVGGDGTVHEVAQGVIGTQAVLGLVPNGSGNDFNRFLGMPRNIGEAVRLLVSGCEKVSVDVAQLTTVEEDETVGRNRWVINSAGFGFDAATAAGRDRIAVLKGLPLYLTSALWTLSVYKDHGFRVSLDDGVSEYLPGLMVCGGLGQFEGGGFRVFPGALHDDGLIDVCMVGSVPKLTALSLLGKAVYGGHATDRNVRMNRARRLRVVSDDPFCVHADGEIAGTSAVSVDLEIKPKCLQVAKPFVL